MQNLYYLLFNFEKCKYVTEQGSGIDDTTTMIVYIGDISGYSEKDGLLKVLGLDFGQEKGQTVEIYLYEAFKITTG